MSEPSLFPTGARTRVFGAAFCLAALDVVLAKERASVALGAADLAFLVGIALATGFAIALGVEALRWLAPGQSSRRVLLATGMLAAVLAGALAFSALSGRTALGAWWRWPAVCAAALAGVALASAARAALARAPEWRPGARLGTAAALLATALSVAIVDGRLFVRLYPAVHLAASVAVVVCVVLAAGVATAGPSGASNSALKTPSRARFAAAGAVMTALVVGGALGLVAASPLRLRVAMVASSPVSRLLVALMPEPDRGGAATSAPTAASSTTVRTVAAATTAPARVAADSSVLLVTIDTLRADFVVGDRGAAAAPFLTQLQAASATFTRAYTTTPHTPYALLSMVAGTCARTAMDLGHGTKLALTPEILRARGHATAAFYPPAVGYVDAERFAPFVERRFGFEHAQVDNLPAAERVTAALDWMQAQPEARAVFAWVHFFEPHEPYEGDARTAPDAPDIERYAAEVRRSDAATATLVAGFRALHPSGTVIVTADHGEEFGEHGGRFHGTTVYDEQVRIPLIWSSPGSIAPGPRSGPVSLSDIAPTLLDVLGVAPPVEMSGVSFAAELANAAHPRARAVFITQGEDAALVTGDSVHGGAASGDAASGHHKWIGRAGSDEGMLFDLTADPGERRDLSGEDPARARAFAGAMGVERGKVALAFRATQSWESVIARASVGDQSIAREVLAGLAHAEPAHRAEAARAAADLRLGAARNALRSNAEADTDARVVRESWLAAGVVGDAAAWPHVVDAVKPTPATRARPKTTLPTDEGETSDRAEYAERAAFALAGHGVRGGETVLRAIARDAKRPADLRRRAIAALGFSAARDAGTVRDLCALLPDPNLRVNVADALGAMGSRAALPCLRAARRVETYAAGREALDRALAKLIGPREVVAR